MPEKLDQPEPFIYRPALIERARNLSDGLYLLVDEIDYHNNLHYPETLTEADRLITLCEQNGINVDRETIELALIGHDILFPIPMSEHPDMTKEQFSAEMYGEILKSIGVEPEKIEKVKACIRFTQAGVHLEDFEVDGKLDEDLRNCLIITRRSDIKNLRDSQLHFLSNSVKLYYESRKLNEWWGTEIKTWPEFVLQQQKYLNMLLDDDLSLGEFDEDQNKECVFTKLARANAAILSSELVMNFTNLYHRYGDQLIKLVPRLAKEKDLDKFAA